MGDTDIGWTHRPGTRGRSWNPTQGCSLKSAGCKNCYAMRMAARFAEKGWSQGLINLKTGKWNGVVRLAEHKLDEPLRWREPSTIFVNSMSDLFHEDLPDDLVDQVFAVMAIAHRHTYLALTKRADRMRAYITTPGRHEAWSRHIARIAPRYGHWLGGVTEDWWPKHAEHIWLGASVEDHAALHRIDDLRATPAALRFLSLEPLLEDLGTIDLTGISWAIDGCESGPGRRPAERAWFASIEEQCRAAGVAYWHKQEFIDGRLEHEFPGQQEFPR